MNLWYSPSTFKDDSKSIEIFSHVNAFYYSVSFLMFEEVSWCFLLRTIWLKDRQELHSFLGFFIGIFSNLEESPLQDHLD